MQTIAILHLFIAGLGENFMRGTLLAALAACLFAVPVAASSKTTWISAPIFVGQTIKPGGTRHVTYYAAIQSKEPDANGYYELFVQTIPHYQESYPDVIAIKARGECDKTGDNSCVYGNPDWKESLVTYTSP